jgi:hypothetical protein
MTYLNDYTYVYGAFTRKNTFSIIRYYSTNNSTHSALKNGSSKDAVVTLGDEKGGIYI